ncbi:4-(cytidine 5'-diphospho)-2-C-methyl-D-erythritol kinase [Hoeflea sp.]|uniref:4-(cytidine 5'-diphospho)-2-C-methyl-D-erythritol kinase n=1 Tax=Hoeflea sp. TaxID=1940281 RepID=UPI0019CE4464|nr:4-(cytidine 5'-diphospho)-2-C-methyl-D-erythritol kinase [Hoeflea sp.]MBC7285409.1 4-(cytidine 5'-diphospho)-2-C-methyl-D-erythritol kinase [Hoeflea sp.]
MQTRDAPAKINLALHVTGRRADGYHLIESFVVFTELGDRVSARPAGNDGFYLDGPEAGVLSSEDAKGNLVVRAREALREAARHSGKVLAPVEIVLDKRLPVASGIGGGSADAAATLQLLCELWEYRPSREHLSRIALRLGADVPMCLFGQPSIARGIGETLEPAGLGFKLDLVIVNPRIGVSTPSVFSALDRRENGPLPLPRGLGDRTEFIAWLAATRNDLEPPARRLVPEIGECLSALTHSGALFARMSGSGASCFGLFESPQTASDAANRLRQQKPGWFVAATRTIAQA